MVPPVALSVSQLCVTPTVKLSAAEPEFDLLRTGANSRSDSADGSSLPLAVPTAYARGRALCRREALNPGARTRTGLPQTARWPHSDGAKPRLQTQLRHDAVRRLRSGDRQGQGLTKKAQTPQGVLGVHERIVADYPGRKIEVILDNLNTRKKNDAWLKRHRNVTLHYTPTRASWLNQIECWFSILLGQSLADASFAYVEQLKQRISDFIEGYNETAEPFEWTKSTVYQRRVKGRRLSDL
jgi:transposase